MHGDRRGGGGRHPPRCELIDNALRYSPPTTVVRISAARGGDAGVLLRIADAGLGMNDADQRIANTRLQAGGEVTPDNARHMGLFVVGRIAARHGIRVGLRGATASEAGSGTTAEIYLPPAVLEGSAVVRAAVPHQHGRPVSPPAVAVVPQAAPPEPVNQNGFGNSSGPPITLLPRRSPGSSGITDVPARPPEQPPPRPRRELATPAWTNGDAQEAEQPPAQAPVQTASDTSAFFAARSRRAAGQAVTPPAAEPGCGDSGALSSDRSHQPPCPRRSLRRRRRDLPADAVQMVDDPVALANSPTWIGSRCGTRAGRWPPRPRRAHQVAHRGQHGLPIRTPGARWCPGRPTTAPRAENPSPMQNGGFQLQRQPQHAASLRDPDAVRASFSSHFDGLRAGRSHAPTKLSKPTKDPISNDLTW